MRFLILEEVLSLHGCLIAQSGGGSGLRDLNALESAVAQPRMSFGGHELYPTLPEKASALGFSLIMNHPFVDGNKRIGHAAMETYLFLDGYEIIAFTDEQEKVILSVAAGQSGREEFLLWLRAHLSEIRQA